VSAPRQEQSSSYKIHSGELLSVTIATAGGEESGEACNVGQNIEGRVEQDEEERDAKLEAHTSPVAAKVDDTFSSSFLNSREMAEEVERIVPPQDSFDASKYIIPVAVPNTAVAAALSEEEKTSVLLPTEKYEDTASKAKRDSEDKDDVSEASGPSSRDKSQPPSSSTAARRSVCVNL